jgi:hypothetical protein
MKSLLIVIALMVGTLSTAVYAADAKKPATQKKQVKKHKKVEGTKVPEKAPAQPKKATKQ